VVIRVLIADDQGMVRSGLRSLLEDEPDIVVVAEAVDGIDAVTAIAKHRPDVVLMDIRMPELDGIEATRRSLESFPEMRVLVLTTFDLDEYVFEALRAGASGFLLKDAPAEDLVAAIRLLARGEALLAPAVTRRVIEQFARTPRIEPPAAQTLLTPREQDVLVELAHGRTNAEIAASLFVSEGTTKTHVSSILAKLGLRDRVQAVIYAYEAGLVQPGR